VTLREQTDHELLQRARRLQTTPEWNARYERRAGIEGTLSQGTRGFGLRRSHSISEARTNFQHILTASAINLVRFAAWQASVPQAKTRISRFTQLKVS
jgi:transposase